MITKVDYKEATCDICGAQETFIPELKLPRGWIKLDLGGNEPVLDVCPTCRQEIIDFIAGLQEAASSEEESEDTEDIEESEDSNDTGESEESASTEG